MTEAVAVRMATSINDIDQARWTDCAATGNPFLRHDFFRALEESGSACAATGWQPAHLVLEAEEGEIGGIMPLYIKGHSQGEYVFDHSWAAAYDRAGGRYYPKLQSSVPFTPVTGPRLLAKSETNARGLLAGARALAEKFGLSGLHITFLTERDAEICRNAGLLIRSDQQFHWRNEGYDSFDQFLAALTSRKRKTIRRERREALADGLTVRTLKGSDITEADWDAFFAFYLDTGTRKWGSPYLNRKFFSLLGENMADTVVLMLANRGGRPIAGALNLEGEGTLYGRYWGALEHHPFLHFELCFYQAIDYAIAEGLSYVEAGAQGEHKIARGYMPVKTRSAHWLRDPGLHDAIARYLDAERREVDAAVDYLSDFAPFRRTDP